MKTQGDLIPLELTRKLILENIQLPLSSLLFEGFLWGQTSIHGNDPCKLSWGDILTPGSCEYFLTEVCDLFFDDFRSAGKFIKLRTFNFEDQECINVKTSVNETIAISERQMYHFLSEDSLGFVDFEKSFSFLIAELFRFKWLVTTPFYNPYTHQSLSSHIFKIIFEASVLIGRFRNHSCESRQYSESQKKKREPAIRKAEACKELIRDFVEKNPKIEKLDNEKIAQLMELTEHHWGDRSIKNAFKKIKKEKKS